MTGKAYGVKLGDQVFAVRADWSDANCPVFSWGDEGWVPTGFNVADYQHSEIESLRAHLSQIARDSGDDAESAAEWAEKLVAAADWMDLGD